MAAGRLGRALTMALCAVLLCAGCREDPAQRTFRRGMQALKRGHYNRSIRLLQKSASFGGTNVAAIYNGLGLAYYRSGRVENALDAFELSAQLDPQAVEPSYNTGVIMAETGREAEALACFKKAAQIDASGTRALEYSSLIFCRNQRRHDAREALNEARRRAPREPRILTAVALVELQDNNVAPAVACLQEALEHDACYAPALYNLAVVHYRWLQNGSQAVPLFKEYLRLAPKGEGAEKAVQALRDIAQPAPTAAETPSVVSAATSAPAVSAAAAVAEKTEPPPPAKVAPAPSGEELLKVARKLEQQGRLEAALNNFLLAARAAEREGKNSIRDQAAQAAGKLCAQNAGAHYEMGQYWVERGRPDEALAHLKQAAELSNTWYEAHFAAARLAMDKDELDTALILLKKADQCRPDRPEALWILAQLYDRNLNLTNQAIRSYELFVERFGADERAREGRMRLKDLKNNAVSAQTNAPPRWQRLFGLHP